MIWNEHESGEEAPRGPVAARVFEQILAVSEDPQADSDCAEETARAVEAYVERNGATVCSEPTHLAVLASRALRAAGEERLGLRLLIFGTGLVRYSALATAGCSKTLVLDLSRIDWPGSGRSELALFAALNVLLDHLAEAWDETDGRGALGLRHLEAVCGSAGGGRSPRRIGEALASEIRCHCAVKLERIAESRGWAHRPALLRLDGPPLARRRRRAAAQRTSLANRSIHDQEVRHAVGATHTDRAGSNALRDEPS